MQHLKHHIMAVRHARHLVTLNIQSRQGHFSFNFGDLAFKGVGGDQLNVQLYSHSGRISFSQRKLILTAFFTGLKHLKSTNVPVVSRVLHL